MMQLLLLFIVAETNWQFSIAQMQDLETKEQSILLTRYKLEEMQVLALIMLTIFLNYAC